MTAHPADAGVASVFAAAGVAVVMAALVIGLHLAAAVIGRHRAEAAADLGALAAASLAVQGSATACRRAGEIAEAGGTRLVHCVLVGWNAAVETEAEIALALPGLTTARGRALAGPAAPESDHPTMPLTRSEAGPSAGSAGKLDVHNHDGEVRECCDRRTAGAGSQAAQHPVTDQPAGGLPPATSHCVTDQRWFGRGERSARIAKPDDPTSWSLVVALLPIGDHLWWPSALCRLLGTWTQRRPARQLDTPLPQLRPNRGVLDAYPRSGSVAIRTPPAGPTPEKAGRWRSTRRELPRSPPPPCNRRRRGRRPR
ncbi:MAG: flp pilus-assembly TadE/G-like family protein [Pseudonocardia sp.]|nr:flp pilus-assembly TadE/G-like family protein [Pseudonocardia sp.]